MKNQKIRDKRKILLILPILILPFLSLAFYAMGGGKTAGDKSTGIAGINASLPNASFGKEKPADKMGIYQESQKDSSKTSSGHLEEIAGRFGFSTSKPTDPTKDIDLKLQQLNAQINAPVEPKALASSRERAIKVPGMSTDVDRLEKLMSSMQGNSGEDQEMKQLSGMLEKVLDIQHPERVRDAYMKQVNTAPEEKFAAIPAEVAAKQSLVQGAVLKLVISDTVTINGT